MSRIAIIGSGISGLGAAFLLHKTHDIALYEKSGEIGGHSRTRVIQYDGRDIPVDTGFIVFNYTNYPHLSRLFKLLGVPVEKSDMTFGVAAAEDDLEWGASSPNALFGQRRNLFRPAFWRLLIDVVRFNATASRIAEADPGLTLEGLLRKVGVGAWFRKYYLLPMGGAIWSCPLETMLKFPALTFTRFFKAHGLLTVTQQPQWYTVTGGSREYVSRLTAPFRDKMRLGHGVSFVSRAIGGVEVTDTSGKKEFFDQVVFACAGDEALGLLADKTVEEQRLLSSFTRQKNVAVLHRDPSLMPKRKRCWSSWIYRVEEKTPHDQICVTYWMNLLQNIPQDRPVFVTLNPTKQIDPALVFDTHTFHHPVYTEEAVAAQKGIAGIQGKNNTWFCGAWLKNGFHEDGLSSAVDVARLMGVEPPWV